MYLADPRWQKNSSIIDVLWTCSCFTGDHFQLHCDVLYCMISIFLIDKYTSASIKISAMSMYCFDHIWLHERNKFVTMYIMKIVRTC